MSRYIATRAIRGAHSIVEEAEELLQQALADQGPDAPAAFPNTAYHLPLILGMTGREVDTLNDLVPVLDHAKTLLHPVPTARRWTPYLGETLDAGMATLLAEEAIAALDERAMLGAVGILTAYDAQLAALTRSVEAARTLLLRARDGGGR